MKFLKIIDQSGYKVQIILFNLRDNHGFVILQTTENIYFDKTVDNFFNHLFK